MSYEIRNELLFNIQPMLSPIDPKSFILDEETQQKLNNKGIGNYLTEASDYYWLIMDFTNPATLIEAFNKWLHDHPKITTFCMLKEISCPLKEDEEPSKINLLELLQPYIPSGVKVIYIYYDA